MKVPKGTFFMPWISGALHKKSSLSYDNEDNHPYCYVKTHYWIRTEIINSNPVPSGLFFEFKGNVLIFSVFFHSNNLR